MDGRSGDEQSRTPYAANVTEYTASAAPEVVPQVLEETTPAPRPEDTRPRPRLEDTTSRPHSEDTTAAPQVYHGGLGSAIAVPSPSFQAVPGVSSSVQPSEDTMAAPASLTLVSSVPETTPPAPPLPLPPSSPAVEMLGGYTRLPHVYVDEAEAALSPAAWKTLTFLLRHTEGFHRPSVRLTLDQFIHGWTRADGSLQRGVGKGVNTRHTLLRALQELADYGILGSDRDERTRTQVRTYWLRPVAEWDRAALRAALDQTEEEAAPTPAPTPLRSRSPQTPQTPRQSTSANFTLVPETTETAPPTSVNNDLVRPGTSVKFTPLDKDTRVKDSSVSDETGQTAQAAAPRSGTTARASRTARPSRTTRPRTAQTETTATVEPFRAPWDEVPSETPAPAPTQKTPTPQTPKAPEGWPEERLPGETQAAFYERAVRAVKSPQVGTAYMASLLLAGVPFTSATIGRLGALAKQVGRYGLVVDAILKASVARYDSDPLDYVTKTARRLRDAGEQTTTATSSTPGGVRGNAPTRTSTAASAERRRFVGSPEYWAQKKAARDASRTTPTP